MTASQGGSPLANIDVQSYLYDTTSGQWLWQQSTTTSSTGDYRLASLTPGQYRLTFRDPLGVYVQGYNGNASWFETAPKIDVVANLTVPDVNVVLDVGRSISGRVSDQATSVGVPGVRVGAYRPLLTGSGWEEVGYAYSVTGGSYEISGLPAGVYRIGFSDPSGNYALLYFGNSLRLETSTDVVISKNSSDPTGIDGAMEQAAKISGTVKTEVGNTSLSEIRVSVYRKHSIHDYWEQLWGIYTDPSGNFTIGGLPAGIYRVGFRDVINRAYAQEFYGDASSVETALDVALNAGSVILGIDAAMEVAGEISGTVTAQSNGAPLEGVRVHVYRRDPIYNYWNRLSDLSTATDAQGGYAIDELPEGVYRVGFRSPAYAEKFYEASPTVETATDVAVVSGGLTSGISASLSAGGQIQGKVIADSGGTALEGVQIDVYRQNPINGIWERLWPLSTATDVLGHYELTGLPEGIYRIGFRDYSGLYAQEFHSDALSIETATSVVVSASQIQTINAALADAETISGTVTSSASGTVLEGIQVEVYRYDPLSDSWSRAANDSFTAGNTVTDVFGRYALRGLAAGMYRIGFGDDSGVFARRFYQDAKWVHTALDVSTSANASINQALSYGSTISGTVTDRQSGRGLAGVRVDVYARHPIHGFWEQLWEEAVITDASGSYTVNGLAEGTYRVGFRDDDSGVYAQEFYGGTSSIHTAQDVAATHGIPANNINGTLVLGYAISGRVTAQGTGHSLAAVQVDVYRKDPIDGYWEQLWEYSTATDEQGRYSVTGLASGTYRVRFRDFINNIYAMEYYGGSSSVDTAQDVSLGLGIPAVPIDVALVVGSSVSGRVYDSAGAPLQGIQVDIYQQHPFNGSWERLWEWTSLTDVNGDYTLRSLPAGTYRIGFRDPGGAWARGFYEQSTLLETARDIPIGTGANLSGIDGNLSQAVSISGMVTDSNSKLLEGIQVAAHRYDAISRTWQPMANDTLVGGNAVTDALGQYVLNGLPAGIYRVGFMDPSGRYAVQYFNTAPTVETAADVPAIMPGHSVPGIDAQLNDSANIRGKVLKQSDNTPLKGIEIQISRYDPLNDLSTGVWLSGRVLSDANGDYEVKGLPPGDYLVEFRDPSGNYAQEYHLDAYWEKTATVVPVAQGQQVPPINAHLVPGAMISGTVTDAVTVAGVQGVEVQVYRYETDSDHWNSIWTGSSIYTDKNGYYEVKGLPEGDYLVEFRDPSGNYAQEYHLDAYWEETATVVPVAQGQPVPNINAELVSGGRISGTVTAQAGGSPLEGVEIQLYRYEANFDHWNSIWVGRNIYTDTNGNYEVKGLPAGDYIVEFRDPSGNYAQEYHIDAFSEVTATVIPVAQGQYKPGIDADLVPGARISGTVTAGAGGAPLRRIEIEVYRYEPDPGYWNSIWTGAPNYTDANGHYDVKGLAAGDYLVKFSDPSGNYAQEYFIDAYGEETAAVISVAQGQQVSGISAELLPGAMISGTVTAEATGLPLQGAQIEVYRYEVIEDEWASMWTGNTIITDLSGAYSVQGLPEGIYQVKATDPAGNYALTYYLGASSSATATDIAIEHGDTKTGIDFRLSRAARIEGNVTSAFDSNPLEGVEVRVYRYDFSTSDWDDIWTGREIATDASGFYYVAGLPEGTYALEFRDRDGVFATRFYSSDPAVEDASALILDVGDLLQEINVALETGLTISGTVLSENGVMPLPGIEIQAYWLIAGLWVEAWQGDTTDANGLFSLSGLSSGTYRLELRDASGRYATEFYINASSLASAEDIVLNSDRLLSSQDLVMDLAASVSGSVTDADAVTPVYGLTVIPYRWNESTGSWERLESIRSQMDGSFEFQGLRPGSYTFEFVDDSANYLSQFYNGKPNLAAAESIILVAGANPPLTNQSLQPAGFTAWMVANGLASASNNALSDDYDLDGLSNGEEYAFGTNPAQAESGQPMEVTAAGSKVTLEFIQLNQHASYSLQERSDLQSGTWLNSQAEMSESPDQTGVAIGYTRMRCTVPATGRKFFRVQATY